VTLDLTNATNHVFQSSGNGLNRITNITSVLLRTARGAAGFDFGTSTETNYDRLEFYVTPMETAQTNTAFLGAWSGETRGRYQFELPGGLVRMEWRYVKDRAISAGRDLVFIDNIHIPEESAPVSALAVRNQMTTVHVKGGASQSFLVESSADLKVWTELGISKASKSGDLTFEEPVKGHMRFYRFTPIQSGAQ
jgi:hypothetical protein